MFRKFAGAAIAITIAMAALLVTACNPTPPRGAGFVFTPSTPPPPAPTALSAAPADPLWTALIAAHTTGAISRRSSLRVAFGGDLIPADKIGSDASGQLRVEPAIKGKATWSSRREIMFTAQGGELAPGTTYKVR